MSIPNPDFLHESNAPSRLVRPGETRQGGSKTDWVMEARVSSAGIRAMHARSSSAARLRSFPRSACPKASPRPTLSRRGRPNAVVQGFCSPRLSVRTSRFESRSSCLHADDTEYTRAVGPRFLISAVARIYQPGCKVDHTLVLEGRQGKQKSEALRAVAIKAEWYTDRPTGGAMSAYGSKADHLGASATGPNMGVFEQEK
jgi:hypothetical protein